jgi:hypothetical protein
VQPPAVRIEALSTERGAVGGQWQVIWRVANAGSQPLRLDDAWLPHGRFRGEGHIPVALTVQPDGEEQVELNVTALEPPGTVVENAYLILRTPGWRLFARMRVEFDASATPHPIVETVTEQSIQ